MLGDKQETDEAKTDEAKCEMLIDALKLSSAAKASVSRKT